jgi:hypothetical protein
MSAASAVMNKPPAPPAAVNARRFKIWELLLLILSLALFGGSALLYATGYPIRNIIFGLQDDNGDRPVGKAGSLQGSVRRQLRKGTEFKDLPNQEILYNRDTVVTGPDSGAKLDIEDGSMIELGPNTMVRLMFAESGSLGGISRAPVLEVVQGEVTGTAAAAPILIKSRTGTREIAKNSQEKVVEAKPAPVLKAARFELPPMPTVASLPPPVLQAAPVTTPPVAPVAAPAAQPIKMVKTLAPQNEVPANATSAAMPLELAWTGGESKVPVRVVISQTGKSTDLIDARIETPEDPAQGERRWQGSLTTAGSFTWKLLKEDGSPWLDEKQKPLQGAFKIAPEWKKISPQKPLVGGRESDSNDFEGGDLRRSPAITFRWKSQLPMGLIPPSTGARVQVWSAENSEKPLLEQTVSAGKIDFSAERLYLGKLKWSVSIPLPGGFVATSGLQEFQVKFNPPVMVVPENDAKVLRAEINRASDGSVILTWKKTLFTDYYEVEVAEEGTFGKVFWRTKVVENYALFKTQKNQRFFWRVRSGNTTGASVYSTPRVFTLQ